MSKIYQSMEALIGGTPLVQLQKIEQKHNLKAALYAKVEYMNPVGSVKDRAALFMLNQAEADGKLTAGGTVIEPTSGNTGIAIAAIGAVRGYRVIVVMPDTMSVERRQMMLAYGAELVLTAGKLGMKGAIAKAEELAQQIPNSIIAGQFENPANPQAHYATTGPEIWQDTDGAVDMFIAGVGTGGTLSGVSKYLKAQKSTVQVIAVEPQKSAILSGAPAGPHGLQGIGAGFVPENLDTTAYDAVVQITEERAFAAGREIAQIEGLLVGISSGAALHAAIEQAKLPENAGKHIVVLLPDTGMRYLSTAMFDA